MNKKNLHAGFTVIEIIAVSVIFIVVAILFFIQFNNLQTKNRDETRKTAINSIYYTLEEVYHKDNGSYPSKINTETLPSVPESILKDRNGVLISEEGSEYRYEPTNCTDDKFASYTLRAELEKEDSFVKKSRN